MEGNLFSVEVFSNHLNLKYFMMARDLNWQQARWSLFLNCFVFVIQHQPGCLSAGLDGLSRRPDHKMPEGEHDNVRQKVLTEERVAKRGR